MISIIIPTYNRAHIILPTLDSINNQTSKEWECLIVDDHSTDETKALIDDYIKKNLNRPFRYLKNKRSKGAQGARNTGIDLAKGDYLMFVDSDDLLLPICIEKRIETIHQNPGFDYYCFTTDVLLPNGETRKRYVLCNELDDLHRFITFQNPWHTMGCTIKRTALHQLGGWDEKLRKFQDCDFYLRLVLERSLQGYKACGLPGDTLFRSNYSEDTITNSKNFDQNIQDTYLLYLTKVRSLLKEHDEWSEYKGSYLNLMFYTYSAFLLKQGKMRTKFLSLYMETIAEFESSLVKLFFFKIYFEYRGASLVRQNKLISYAFKVIPKTSKLPHAKEWLW